MKMATIACAALLCVLSLSIPVSAQSRGSAGTASSPQSFSGGGGGGYGGGGGASSPSHAPRPEVHYELAYAQGSATEYVASAYVSFEEAVKLGQQVLTNKPKSVAEVAAEYRAARKPTP